MDFVAVIAGTVSAFAVGGIWFGPKTFYPLWWKALGMTEDQAPGGQHGMGVVFGATFVSQLIQAIGLTWLLGALGQAGFFEGAKLGFIVGLVFAAMPSLTHRLFGRQGFTVWAIEIGGDIAALTVMGAVIGALI
jgi:hypothetical protein